MNNFELERCLRNANQVGFDLLWQQPPLNHPVFWTDAARVVAVEPDLYLPYAYGDEAAFTGTTNKTYSCPHDLEDIITLPPRPPHPNRPDSGGSRVAIGAVIDETSRPPLGYDMPVVVAIGINYGQQSRHDYVNAPPGLYDDTGLRPKLEAVTKFLKCSAALQEEYVFKYHLVVANFFPWITKDTWRSYDFNSITEELLIRFYGWRGSETLDGPLEFVRLLLDKLCDACAEFSAKSSVTHIIFHGAHSVAPRYGAALVARQKPLPVNRTPLLCPQSLEQVGPHVIFCDNLAPSQQPTMQNAVLLTYDRQEDHEVLELDE